ncbi:hypothetical protein B0H19DRAFT_106603 [Mycena capillaripes]|nr:hypothetical protein B0H19DRAFT_106603 [Mycena capillaripes]
MCTAAHTSTPCRVGLSLENIQASNLSRLSVRVSAPLARSHLDSHKHPHLPTGGRDVIVSCSTNPQTRNHPTPHLALHKLRWWARHQAQQYSQIKLKYVSRLVPSHSHRIEYTANEERWPNTPSRRTSGEKRETPACADSLAYPFRDSGTRPLPFVLSREKIRYRRAGNQAQGETRHAR